MEPLKGHGDGKKYEIGDDLAFSHNYIVGHCGVLKSLFEFSLFTFTFQFASMRTL